MELSHAEIIDETPLNAGFAAQLSGELQKRWSRWLVMAFAALNLLFFAAQIFGWIELEEIALISDISTATLATGSFLLAWRVTRHESIDDSSRRVWQFLMLSFFAYACGEGLWLFYSKIVEIEPFPSWADAGYLAFYPIMLSALLLFPTARTYTASEKLKLVMDVAIVMIATSVIVWYFIINPTIQSATGEEWLKPALAVAYVVGDIVMLLGVTTVILRGVAEESRRTLFIVIGGLTSFAFADLGFAYLTVQNLYISGHWVDNFWIVGDFALLYAAHYHYAKISQPTDRVNETDAENPVQAFSWLPYLAIALGCGLLLIESRQYWSEPLGIVIFASLGMTALVVLRQIIAVKENVKLHAEKTLRQHEMRFGALVQNSSDMISILSPGGEILFESPSIKNVLGYEIDELVGSQSFAIIHPDDAEDRKKILETVASDPAFVIQKEFRFKHKDGSWRFLETVSRLFEDEENNLRGVLINSRDVTQRKMDEEKLRLYMTKLEKSNRELQDFAYVASHDLQEPLRKVQAFGDRLQRKCGELLNEEGQDYIKRMRDASARMQTLINDLLTFSRVTTKAQPFKPIDLRKIADEVVSDLEVRIEQTGGSIEIGELPVIDADALQMRQLFQNLIGNALKFHRPEAKPHVKIYAEKLAANGASFEMNGESIKIGGEKDFCRVVIEDNGIGFEEKYLDRIFTVFQRLHGRSEYEGSGIGLAVCRKIVERHGGQITAKSSPGEGARFYIELPVGQENENDEK